jgi:ribonuclease P protein component
VKKLTFSKVSRLRQRKAFEFIFAKGSKASTKDLVMWYTLGTEPEAGKQIGIIASKKTGGAVRRNRLKRLLREAFRLSKNELKDGARLIIYFKAGCAIDSLQEAAAGLDKILTKTRLKK